MLFKKARPAASLSAEIAAVWKSLPIRYLILATTEYIVFVDEALDVDWKTTSAWDRENAATHDQFSAILSRAAQIESNDWDHADDQVTLSFKRQVGEGIARGLERNFADAHHMLDKAEAFRQRLASASRRIKLIKDQIEIKNLWRRYFKIWIVVHYGIGIGALLLSTLVASKPSWLDANQTTIVAWLVAAFTGLLTFLTPDKKADKFVRAWSVLNSEITRYNANDEHKVEDVLNAYHRGENIIHETPLPGKRKR